MRLPRSRPSPARGTHYGGKTTTYTFSSGDKSYDVGIAKQVVYQDVRGTVMKSENYLTEEFAKKKGNTRFIIYGSGADKRVEIYHTEEYAKRNGGVVKSVIVGDKVRKIRKDGTEAR